jgi:xanthine/CO dehydrogenase XdhC/CoxF family maturation factor
LSEVYEEIERCLREGEAIVIATVASTRGSTPRKAGAKMMVRADGSCRGTIGGGCGEAEVRVEAMEALRDGRPRLVTVELTEAVESEDRICGGVMEVFLERLGGPVG